MFPELSLATLLTLVSWYYMTPFNCGGKKARDVGLTCRCHLSNIMPDRILYNIMEWGMTFFSLKGGNRCLPQHRKDGLSLTIITPVGVGKH